MITWNLSTGARACSLALLVLASAGCAALAQAPAICLDRATEITSPELKPIVLKEQLCMGPRR